MLAIVQMSEGTYWYASGRRKAFYHSLASVYIQMEHVNTQMFLKPVHNQIYRPSVRDSFYTCFSGTVSDNPGQLAGMLATESHNHSNFQHTCILLTLGTITSSMIYAETGTSVIGKTLLSYRLQPPGFCWRRYFCAGTEEHHLLQTPLVHMRAAVVAP